LAREMHDVLAHSLSGLALQLESARLRAASHDDPELVAALERAHQLARTGIEEARRAIGMLRDDELPGPERLPALVAEFERDSGIATSFSVAGEPHELGPDARLTLFRTAQEALTNVQKHASCDHVELCLVYEDGGTRLSVEDVGQLVPASNGAGYGLTGVREGLASLLGLLPDLEVVGVASDGEEAVALVERLRPEVVLMDLRMPRCDGVEATRRIRERAPETHVVVLTTYGDDRSVVEALRAGARGFLTKDAGAEEIQRAIAAVVRGEAAIDPAVQHHLVHAVAGRPDLPDDLTPREAEVLALVAQGLSNGEIAARLVITEATVKSHVNHLFAKTGVRHRAQAVTYA